MPRTIIDHIWDQHVVRPITDTMDLLYIDRHYIHEVTSPQAFSGLDARGLKVFRPEQTLATADHNVPTVDQHLPISNSSSRKQVELLTENCDRHGITLFGIGHAKNGIVHVIGPENGYTLPGMTIVCGDSHTSTHGAFGSIAFGIGTTQVEHVLAAQCLLLSRPKTMRIRVEGKLAKGTTAKDVALYVISRIGAQGATGYFVEFAGEVFRNFSMEERMTVCNMSIEMGARGGLVGIDGTTIDYVQQRVSTLPTAQILTWLHLNSADDATFDREEIFDGARIPPIVTTGTSPDSGVGIDDKISSAMHNTDQGLKYMQFDSAESMLGKHVDYVFIGSCTNSRIEDLRLAAQIVRDQKKAAHVKAWVVPGSNAVRQQAIEEGLHEIFENAGFEFREPGCSACLAMNEDKIPAGSLCVSTSNRNFEGRQGPGARTVLASPLTAALAAIEGKITDPRTKLN